MGLAHTGRPQQQHVGGLGDEGQVVQILDQPLVDGGLEAKVELLQGALERQMRHSGLGGGVALPPGGDFQA